MAKSSAKRKDLRLTQPELDPDQAELEEEIEDRNEELLEGAQKEDIRQTLTDVYKEVEKGFQDQWERSNEQIDFWNAYNCKLGQNQYYSGNAKIFVPIIHDAVNARITRFTNQIFPSTNRFVECTTEDGTQPHALMALLEHYIGKTKLRTKIVPPLLRNGDVEGQLNLYVSWSKRKRHVVWKDKLPDSDTWDVKQEMIEHASPDVEVLSDGDVLVLPATADSLEEALAAGGSVTVLRRWSKAKIKKMVKSGDFIEEAADKLIEEMAAEKSTAQTPNKAKNMADAAGIRGAGKKHAQIYETWVLMGLDGEDEDGEPETQLRLCRAYLGGSDNFLGCKRNPFWADKLPVLSVPLDKVQGSFKGISKVKPCVEMQYFANDSVNEGADSLYYSLAPIVLTDPARNPRVGSMVLSMAAIWETDPKATRFEKFPNLLKEALDAVNAAKSQIHQTLGINPAMMTQSVHRSGKRSQAEVAQEQQVDILTTADVVSVVEEGILTPLLQRFIELDHQYRDDDLMIRQFGEMGLRARMEKIPPVQFSRRYEFKWFGVEQARSMQQLQQQIAFINVLRGIPPDQLKGRQIDLVPLVTHATENIFGPRLAPLIFKDMKDQLSIDPNQENEYLLEGLPMPVHLLDDDPAHIKAHQQIAQQSGDPSGAIRVHMMAHMQQLQTKNQLAMLGAMSGAQGGAQPSAPGAPRQGAQARVPRQQGPPGMIHQDTIGPQSGQPPRLRQGGGV